MLKIISQLCLFIIIMVLCPSIYTRNTQIPSHLLGCYRNNVSLQLRALQVPLTSKLLVELVRNVEQNLETVLDMRTMASSMLHSLKFDGIQRAVNVRETEKIIPIGPTSMHFNMYKLLIDYLLPGEAALFPMNTLSMNEMCTLHYIMSSSVQAWARGDEIKTCPKEISIINKHNPYPISTIRGQQKSTCPIERGVMRSGWGDVAPGRLLTGIVAALNMQEVKLETLLEALTLNEDTPIYNNTKKPRNVYGNVNNVWAATTAGDLAEVVVYQGKFVDKLILGPSGVWNDSLIPRNHYLPNSIGTHWEMTSAEVLGGIDGALIATKMSEWTKEMSSLRMSQILDMYYSKKGIAFDPQYRACQRRELFSSLINKIDLTEQTSSVAKLLTYSHIAYQTEDFFPQPEEQIEKISAFVVENFKEHLNQLTDLNSDCEKGDHISPMEILVVIDGTWVDYHGRRLVAALTHAADVSYYGSSMGFISGSTGRWLTNVTNKIFNIFEDIHHGEIEHQPFWPTSFTLTKGLETVTRFIQNETDKECTNKLRSTRPIVILVMANTAVPNDHDLITAQKLISSIKAMQPGTSIIYAASKSNVETYNELAKNIYMNDHVVATEKEIQASVNGIFEVLKIIPRQLMEVHCGITPLEYEDYIPYGTETVYEIPYHFLQITKNIIVQFKGNDYGEISICANDKDVPVHKVCKGISTVDNSNGTSEILEHAEFKPQELCTHEYACIVEFKATVKNTKYKCAEDDCRFPDQARINIKTSWISSSYSIKSNVLIITLTYLLVYVAF